MLLSLVHQVKKYWRTGVDYFRMQPMMSLGRAQNIDEKLLLQNNKEELLQIIYAARENDAEWKWHEN